MELVRNLFKKKDNKQKKLLNEIGVEGEVVESFVGPNYEKGPVVEVDEQKFLSVLEETQKTEFRRKTINQSDTHRAFNLFLNIGEVWLKTATTVIDYSKEENLVDKLHEKGFRYDRSSSKREWAVFKKSTTSEVENN